MEICTVINIICIKIKHFKLKQKIKVKMKNKSATRGN